MKFLAMFPVVSIVSGIVISLSPATVLVTIAGGLIGAGATLQIQQWKMI
ncbi:hypothetical protein G7B40_040410 [Aetokthonos hydrillicola Thurmond2011]|uniref:Uncharacterized protein n=1 Tax=Aetokthonos hydrillicola Thurmond2011 TaxID=2712845 RepID=A0AAP5MDL8_9CYAN|nr:hypothetical protein [Aetokthonos hydrillicola]MBO3463680.1 hypothetical protein [Aetokthonos hydrillicola CCALA 1050]MDR9900752.1 hypothetical protein [Aetokthonos hydrillicola Thurmond2011]